MFHKYLNFIKNVTFVLSFILVMILILSGIMLITNHYLQNYLLNLISVIKDKPLNALFDNLTMAEIWLKNIHKLGLGCIFYGIFFSLLFISIFILNRFKRLSQKKMSLFIASLLLFIITLNLFFHIFRIRDNQFDQGYSITLIKDKPSGFDFNVVYQQANTLKKGINQYLKIGNIYPPFVPVFALPLSFINFDVAYRIQTLLILISLFLIIYYSLIINLNTELRFYNKFGIIIVAILLFTLFYNTYPVLFSLERGNYDIIAGLFSIISLYSITRNNMLLSIITLTIAVNFKIYPLILFAFILLKFGWKTIPIFLLTNIAALFIIGYKPVVYFFIRMSDFISVPYQWEGDHSLFSFIYNFLGKGNVHSISYIISLIFIILFIIVWLKYFINYNKKENANFTLKDIGLIGMAFQLMSLLPSVSHDYQLPVQIIPYLLLINSDPEEFQLHNNFSMRLVIILSISMGILFSPRFDLYLGEKTPFIVLNFIIYMIIALKKKNSEIDLRVS